MKYKALILTEDLKMFSNDFDKKIEEFGDNHTVEEWKELIRSLQYVYVKKGTIFYESKIVKRDEGKSYLYCNEMASDALKPKDDLFRIVTDIYTLWERHLSLNAIMYDMGKYETITTEQVPFEYTFIPHLNNEIITIEEDIENDKKRILRLTNILNEFE